MNMTNRYIKTTPIFQQQGFTLIEVMVASVILFSSIAAVTMLYRGAYLSSDKANQQVNTTGMIPIILANVRNEIRMQGNTHQTTLTGKSAAWQVNYSWQAQMVEHKGAPVKIDTDSGDYITPPPKYKLWDVKLTLINKTTSKSYQFYELSWSDE
tara:strand:+ start:8569 stop:9030 length:462 start_codon:yes stop_codon:yes gene_type:complete